MTNGWLQDITAVAPSHSRGQPGEQARAVARLWAVQHLPMKVWGATPLAVVRGLSMTPFHANTTPPCLQCCLQPDVPDEIAN